MQILFFIGNGFDINLGMKTRYCDFYEYYKSINSNNEAITSLKQSLGDDLTYWSDLELAIGDYTSNLNSTSEFDNIFDDIGDTLAEYLRLEEEKLDNGTIDAKRIVNYLTSPEKFLDQADTNALTSFKKLYNKNPWHINVITFNYTKTIDNLLQNLKDLGINEYGVQIKFKNLFHIHGYIDKQMVLGVNDISQITNTSFHNNQDVLESLVKIDCNKANKHTIDNQCISLVSSADLICIFGCSIGVTDNFWWEQIGKRLKHGAKVIIYKKGTGFKPRNDHKKARIERETKRDFFNKTKLSNEDIENFYDNVYVGVNTKMFDLNN